MFYRSPWWSKENNCFVIKCQARCMIVLPYTFLHTRWINALWQTTLQACPYGCEWFPGMVMWRVQSYGVTLCDFIEVNHCFAGIYCLHLQGWGASLACLAYFSALKIVAVYSLDISVYQLAWSYSPKDSPHLSHAVRTSNPSELLCVSQGGLLLQTMKKRFFILRGDSSEASARLEYYEDEKKWKKNHSPRRYS